MSGSRSWQAGRRPDGRQAEWARRSGRRSLQESRRSRTVKLAAAICGLVALIAVGIYLASRYQPITQPALAVIGDPLYRDLQIPPNAGADQGNHIDLIRLKEDAGHLFAPVAEPSLQDWNLLTADRLLRESQERLAEISRELPSDERTVVIYCGLLGLSRNGKAMLLVSDASGTDREIPSSEWIQGLSAAAEEAGAKVLVLIDPGPATVSWSQGILAPDFAAQLESELAAKPVKNLCVILASGPGETSWRITDVPAPIPPAEEDPKSSDAAPAPLAEPHGLGRSIFSYYVVSGLRGEATDRSGRAIRTADDKPYGNSDGRITANELFTYVSQKVDRWATSQRGVRQTVTKFGGDGNFLVGAVTKRPPAPKPNEQAKAESTGSSKADEKPEDKPKEPPAVAAERRLTKLWELRDRLAASSPPGDAISPAAWRELQSRLLAAELRLRIGLVDAAVKVLDEAEGQIETIASTAEEMDLGKRFGGTWLRPFLPTIPVGAASKPATPDAGGPTAAGTTPAPAPPDLAAQLDEAAKSPPPMPLPNEQAIRERLADREALAKALDWVVGKGSTARSSEDWAALGRVAALLPAGEVSPELRTVQRLAAASKTWTDTDSDKKASLAARVLRMLDRFGRVGLDDPASLATCRHMLAEGLLATAAAERWLVLAGDTAEAERHLRRAETALRNLEQATAAVSNARRLQQRLDEQLPELARWLASVREREPKLSAEDDRYERVQTLSADLNALASDAVSPESDWGRLQSRIDAAWTSANIDDASGIGADLTTLSFGERRLAALLRTLAESDPEARNRDAINARLRETVAALEALPLAVSNAIADLVSQPDWSDIDTQLHFASLPGFDAASRQRLRSTLQKNEYSTSNGTPGESRRWEAGTWHGFWSQQVLKPFDAGNPSSELASERSAQFDRVWEAFLEGASDAEGSQIASRRADLGAAVRGLAELEQRPGRATSSAAGGSDVPTLLGLFADVNSLSGDAIDLRKAWSALPVKARPTAAADEKLIARDIGAALADVDSVVASDGLRGATLTVQSFPQRGHLSLRTGTASNPIDVYVAEKRMQNGELPADAVNPTPTVQFRSDLTGDESVIVALIDKDQFPLAIQRIRVVPEVGEERWRIRFAAAANRTEVLSDAPEVLSLPPRTDKPLALVPVLEFPAAAPTEIVSVEVQQRDNPVSDDWRTVLGPKTFPLRDNSERSPTGDLRRLVLDFTPAPTTPAEPAVPPAATADSSTTFSFENGLRFLVRLDGKELPPREIWPVTFDAGRFVSEDAKALGVRLEGTPPRIEALITATTGGDPRIPETVPVELHFDRTLDPLVGDQKATKGFVAPGSGGTLRLFGQIADGPGFEQLLMSSTGGTVALSVAGLPRAYRWRLRAGQEPDRIQPTDSPLELEFVRRAAPPNAPPAAGAPAALPAIEAVPVDPTLNAAMIGPTELPNVSLRYFVYQLEDRASAAQSPQPSPRTIIVRRSEPGRQETSQVFFSEQIVRRFATRMNAAVTGAVWNVSVESEPHAIPLGFEAVGRFEVTTVLRTPGIDDADATSRTIRLVIDGTSPETQFLSPSADGPVPADRPLPVVCSISDPESGVHSAELRVDVDGSGAFEAEKDAVKVFDESELAADAVSDPWYRDGKVQIRWNVPVQLIPPAPKEGKLDRVTIWAVAKNRRGLTVEKPLQLELKRAKVKPPPPPPTTGDIVVTVTPKPRPPVAPEIVLVAPDGGTENRSGTSATFSKLKPGPYEIRVTQGTTGFKGQGAAKVTVEAGKKSTVHIKVE